MATPTAVAESTLLRFIAVVRSVPGSRESRDVEHQRRCFDDIESTNAPQANPGFGFQEVSSKM